MRTCPGTMTWSLTLMLPVAASLRSGTTNALGFAAFSSQGPCGVGAVAFLLDAARRRPLAFDRTTGTVTRYVIPQ